MKGRKAFESKNTCHFNKFTNSRCPLFSHYKAKRNCEGYGYRKNKCRRK